MKGLLRPQHNMGFEFEEENGKVGKKERERDIEIMRCFRWQGGEGLPPARWGG
ncbi:unnamed protein product [Prunus armeniaca]|uniref:Uncharacterized protein n=1 Tax=Prunus armeniaca TaxID=36596 RepID=A0A6J5WRB2_PRUAR|nr:unnamed protein product [Prunus armeniaca]CAB4302252.1 unnamed protein product [Prunus armeniaca]